MGKGRSTGGAGGGTKAKVQQQPQKYTADSMKQFFATATPAEADQLLNDLRAMPLAANEENSDVQRFMNAIGWTSNVPETLSETAYQQALQQAGNPQQLYHADNVDSSMMKTNSRQYAQQYMGISKDANGNAHRQYVAGGVYGGGTYFADSAGSSAGYGDVQFRGFLNANAKVIDHNTLMSQMRRYAQTHSGFSHFMTRATTKYGGSGYTRESVSIFAAMNGYNVITNSRGYYAVLDRSATTVSSRTELTRNIGRLNNW